MWKWLIAKAPKIGSVWVLSTEVKDPFRPSDNYVVVSHVRDGYVKYARPTWATEYLSNTIRDFRDLYREVK